MDVINLTDADFDKYGKVCVFSKSTEIPTALCRSKLMYYTSHHDEQSMAVRMCLWSSMHRGADTARYVSPSLFNHAAFWSDKVLVGGNCDFFLCQLYDVRGQTYVSISTD